MSKGLLDGVVVLDLTRVLAGPYSGMILADMGATVIKLENPKGGDDTRKMGPFINDNSVYYANFNRSKLGCTLNLKDPEGKEIFRELVKKADIVIENYRPGTMEKLGLGYDVLKEVNPGIIYGAVSGFGHTGPYSKRAGYDIVGQAMGGLMSTTGWPDGEPTRSGTPMGDVLGGLNLTIGVLGQLTLGCCGFEAIGAYSAALLSKLLVANGVAMDPTLRFLLTTLAGGVVACIFGILVGIPALRLHGDYLAIITLGFGEIIRVIIQNLKVAGGMGLDKGAAGQALIGIDRLANLYVVFWITVVTVVLLFMFARSRYGRAVKAIRDDEIAASASGINITYMKVLVFAISAFFAGIAGGIFAQYIGSLNPAMAGWLQSINYVIMVVFGGMGSLTGSIVSAIALTILPELLRAFSTYRMLVYSVALVLIMIFRPQGIFGNWEFSLTKTINKLFYPMKVKAHGKSKQAESTAKAVKDTAKTDETVETAADTKEAQA